MFSSHPPWGPGNRSCDLLRATCFAASAIIDLFCHPPTHRFQVFCLLPSYFQRLQVFCFFLQMVRLRRSAWYGYQWCLKKLLLLKMDDQFWGCKLDNGIKEKMNNGYLGLENQKLFLKMHYNARQSDYSSSIFKSCIWFWKWKLYDLACTVRNLSLCLLAGILILGME